VASMLAGAVRAGKRRSSQWQHFGSLIWRSRRGWLRGISLAHARIHRKVCLKYLVRGGDFEVIRRLDDRTGWFSSDSDLPAIRNLLTDPEHQKLATSVAVEGAA
jgi:hypothetical protein